MSLLLIIGIAGCSKDKAASASPDKSAPGIAVEIMKLRPVEMVEGIDITGDLSPKNQTDIKPEVSGKVLNIYVKDWVKVNKGTPLAIIDSKEYDAIVKKAGAGLESAKAALMQAKVSDSRAQRELARMIELKKAGLATQQSLDDAYSQSDAAEANVEAVKAQMNAAREDFEQAKLRRSKCLIVSPIEGVVSERNINIGDLAGDPVMGKPLFRIVDNRILELVATVASTDISRLKIGQRLDFTTDSSSKTYQGTLKYINPRIDESTRSIKVLAEIDNKDGELRGGLYAKGRIITGERKSVLMVPRTSVLSWDIAKSKGRVFIASGETAKQKEVVTGGLAGSNVVIVSGLNAGDHVITRGGFNVKDGDRINVIASKEGK